MASALSDSRKRLRSPSSSSVCSSPKRPASEDPPDPLDHTSQRVAAPNPPQLSSVAAHTTGSATAMSTTARALPDEPADTLVPASDRLQHIAGLQKASFKLGDIWYLVSKSWWRRFEIACTGKIEKGEQLVSHDELGPVDNSDLFDGDDLKPGLTENQDVELLPQEAWDALVRWYGPPSRPIPRPVLALGPTQTILSFYIYEFHLFILSASPSGAQEASASPNSFPQPPSLITLFARQPISALYEAALASLSALRSESSEPTQRPKLRIWKLDEKASSEILKSVYYPLGRLLAKGGRLLPAVRADDGHLQPVVEAEPTLQDCLLSSHDMLVIEYASKEGLFPLPQPETVPGNTSTVASPSPRNDPLPEAVSSPAPLVPLFGSGAIVPGQERKDFFSRFEKEMPRSSSALSPSKPGSQVDAKDAKGKEKRGTVGLANLGNTCFMNSALQCLAHTEELVEYFLTGVFRTELNPTNPLGMGGQIAESFGALLNRLWSPVSSSSSSYSSSHAPREFKSTLARFAPQFSGYAQHDSQELLAFLLDGLHEDLNRVLKKPYVEKPDWPGEGSARELIAFARECWDGYLKRNDSVIVDLFQGQYKSTLVCPECEKVSITFDPYMYLTLPLPVSKKWRGTVYFVPWALESPQKKILLEISKDADFRRLKERVAQLTGSQHDHLLAAEPYEHRFWKFFEDGQPVAEVGDKDYIAIFELPIALSQPRQADFGRAVPVSLAEDDWVIVPIFMAQARTSRFGMESKSRKAGSSAALQDLSLFGYPFILALTKEQASDQEVIYNLIAQRVSRVSQRRADLWNSEHPTADLTEVIDEDSSHVSQEDQSKSTSLAGSDYDVQGAVAHASENLVEGEDDSVMRSAAVTDIEMSNAGAPSSTPPARRDLFKMHLLQHSKNPGEGILVSGWSYESTTRVVDWEERREEARGGLRVLPGGFREELDDDPPIDSDDNEQWPTHPLIRLGEAIFCEWSEDTQRHFFDESAWGGWEDVLDPEVMASDESARVSGLKPISLYDCLSEFTREEQLGADDLWYCPRCKKHQQATKRFEIWSVPDILVVHLKRFSSSRSMRDKLDVFVDFPVEGLNLEGRVEEKEVLSQMRQVDPLQANIGVDKAEEPLLYDLFAVDEHLGGLGGGHYRAYARNYADGQWYHFDDSHVSQVADARQAVNSNAYLLFYRRRTSRPLGGKTHEKIEQAKQVSETLPQTNGLGAADDPFAETPSSPPELVLPLPMPGYSLPDTAMHSPSSSDSSSSGSGGPAYSPPSPPSFDVAPANHVASSAASGLDVDDTFAEPLTLRDAVPSSYGGSMSGDVDDTGVATPSDVDVDKADMLDRLGRARVMNAPGLNERTWEETGQNGRAWTAGEYEGADGPTAVEEVEMGHESAAEATADATRT